VDQKVQAPFQNNLLGDEDDEIEQDDENVDIHLMENSLSSTHLTQEQYEDELIFSQSQECSQDPQIY